MLAKPLHYAQCVYAPSMDMLRSALTYISYIYLQKIVRVLRFGVLGLRKWWYFIAPEPLGSRIGRWGLTPSAARKACSGLLRTSRALEMAAKACPGAARALELPVRACCGAARALEMDARACPGATRAFEMDARACPVPPERSKWTLGATLVPPERSTCSRGPAPVMPER